MDKADGTKNVSFISQNIELQRQIRIQEFSVRYQDFICGWGAAVCNITITYPLNKIIFRQMLSGMRFSPAIKEIYSEGIGYLYRGILPPLIQKSISLSLMFGVYENCRRPLVENGVNKKLACIIAGVVAGTVEATLMPFERIQTLLSDKAYHTRYRNTSHAFHMIGKHYGYREFYRGLVPILLRNGPSNAMFFLIREEYLKQTKLRNIIGVRASDFISGAFLGAFVSCVFYPINVMKIAAQSTVGGRFRSVKEIFYCVYFERDRSLRKVYRGVTTNCTRSFFSWGVMNTAYQYLRDIIN